MWKSHFSKKKKVWTSGVTLTPQVHKMPRDQMRTGQEQVGGFGASFIPLLLMLCYLYRTRITAQILSLNPCSCGRLFACVLRLCVLSVSVCVVCGVVWVAVSPNTTHKTRHRYTTNICFLFLSMYDLCGKALSDCGVSWTTRRDDLTMATEISCGSKW